MAATTGKWINERNNDLTEVREMNEAAFDISEINIRFETGRSDGIIAWASMVLNRCLFIGDIAVRKDGTGQVAITFPARKKDERCMYFYHKPINGACHEEIRQAIEKSLTLR